MVQFVEIWLVVEKSTRPSINELWFVNQLQTGIQTCDHLQTLLCFKSWDDLKPTITVCRLTGLTTLSP